MEKTCWLYEPLLKEISDSQSLTGHALRLVCSELGTDSCAIWLNERSVASGRVLLVGKSSCRYVTPEDEAFAGLRACAPAEMSCKDAYSFGLFYCGKQLSALNKKGRDAFSVFCEYLYSDFMVGFFDSDDPVALEVRDIVMNYGNAENSPNVLSGVSFVIRRNQLTVIMGASGCGKSTALNIAGGLLRPTSGSVLYKGNDVCRYTKKQMNGYRRNSVGFIFQNYNLIQDLTVRENIQLAASLAEKPGDMQQILASLGIAQYADKYPFHMSGGEQQRTCIARALVKNADVLLCDEPTGALDTVNSKNIMTILQHKARESRTAVAVVTHNPDFVALADHYIEMRNGSVVLDEYRPFPYNAEDCL